MYYYDPTYFLTLLGAVICMIASANVNSTFRRYSSVGSQRHITAAQAAEWILRSAGIYDVTIQHVAGDLTDHYAPNEKVLRLSDSVYNSTSVAAIGVAAHECGHAIQHQVGYAPLALRSLAVPLASIGSTLSWPLILIGILLGFGGLAKIGVILFLFVVFFQLITLPVEFNASHRAMQVLESGGLLATEELSGARKVLTAAAMTYVAAVFSAILQLVRLIAITGGTRRRR